MRVCVCVRECVCARERVCVHACACVCVYAPQDYPVVTQLDDLLSVSLIYCNTRARQESLFC